jgi:hypothetical protein
MRRGEDPISIQETFSDMDSAATSLLHDLTCWREQLARSIARNNLALRSDAIATSVNRIIGRFLILRIADDRGLIAPGFLQEMYSAEYQYQNFLELFPGDCDPWSHLPMPQTISDTLLADLVIDAPVIETILSRLSQPDRPYHFSTISTDTVAHVLSRYLTKTVRRSATHQATIVDTHNTVLSEGIPDPALPVIEYIVQSTLEAVIASRSHREILPLRMIDPACGTGRVLLAAYRYLIGRHRRNRLTFNERKQILVDSFHGVDIDRNAVAITTMLLVFRLCEDESEGSLPDPFLSIMSDVLRSLSNTIRCGNALVGPDIVCDESWMFCSPKERHSLNLFLWKDNFPEIVAAGGFDVVIGNPPDGPLEQKEWIQQYFQRHYVTYHPQADRSAYFVEYGLRLLRYGGALGGVMSDRFLRSHAGSPLRALLKEEQPEEIIDISSRPDDRQSLGLCIIRLSHRSASYTMFAALVDPAWPGDLAVAIRKNRFPVDPVVLDQGGWTFRDTRKDDLLQKIRLRGTPLEETVMDPVHGGIEAARDPLFMIDAATRSQLIKEDPRCKPFIRPVIDGQEIGRYSAPVANRFLVFIPQGWTRSHLSVVSQPWRWVKRRQPVLARYLKQYSDHAKLRTEAEELWWETPCDPDLWLEKHRKLFFRNHFETLAFSFDDGRTIPDPATAFILSSNLYLCGVLNSRLMAFVFHELRPSPGTGPERYTWDDLRNLPVYIPDFDEPSDANQHERMIGLIKRMLDLKKLVLATDPGPEQISLQKKIDATDVRIDALVYALYGLTAEEIELVELVSI